MFNVKETRRVAPVRALIYGDGGVGKSTLGASAPDAIFVAAEDGLLNIDARAVEPAPRTWVDALAALDWIATLKHKTIVVDSLDWLEPLCWQHVCTSGPKKYADIEAFGYGKGYIAALSEWRIFIHKLAALREKGMHILLIAHAVRKPFKNPEGDDFDRFSIKLHEKAAGLVKEWVDVVGFASHETAVVEQDGRNKGKSTGKRIIRCNPTAAFDAKTRFAMPRTIPLDWSAFARAVEIGSSDPKTRLKAQLDVALKELDDAEMAVRCGAFLAERGETVASLSEALETVNGYLNERRKAG